MKRIFVSAYACEPGLGSEIGVGWHWVLEMSRYYRLWVLTRESNRATIEGWLAQNAEAEDASRSERGEGLVRDIQFVYFDLPKWARFWKRGLRGVRTYYNIWQRCTNRIVKQVMRENDIKIFHHLTYGNVMWPVSNYGSKQLFVWGPVGGLETISDGFAKHYDSKQRIKECVRRMVAWTTCHSTGFKKRCRRADLILCKTDITRNQIPEKYRHKAILFTDVAADNKHEDATCVQKNGEGVQFIVVGRLEAWRGFDLAIEALAQSGRKDFTLTIVGNGPDRGRLEGICKSLGVDGQVEFTGKVSMDDYRKIVECCDVVMNPSLKEGAVTVSFDAMALGKPLLAKDTSGYTRYFSPDYSIVVPLLTRDAVIKALAKGMIRLSDLELRKAMGAAARAACEKYSWYEHGLEIRDAFEKQILK